MSIKSHGMVYICLFIPQHSDWPMREQKYYIIAHRSHDNRGSDIILLHAHWSIILRKCWKVLYTCQQICVAGSCKSVAEMITSPWLMKQPCCVASYKYLHYAIWCRSFNSCLGCWQCSLGSTHVTCQNVHYLCWNYDLPWQLHLVRSLSCQRSTWCSSPQHWCQDKVYY